MSKQSNSKKTTRAAKKPALSVRSRIVLGAVVIVLIGTVASFNLQPIAHAVTLATTRQPQGYTELSLDASAKHPLPASAPAGTVKSFSFTITNHEQKPVTYAYTVTVNTGSGDVTVDSGTAHLANGATRSIATHFTIAHSGKTGLVTVHLLTTNQQLFFRSYS